MSKPRRTSIDDNSTTSAKPADRFPLPSPRPRAASPHYPNTSIFTRALAITIVVSMIVTMPGVTSWADGDASTIVTQKKTTTSTTFSNISQLAGLSQQLFSQTYVTGQPFQKDSNGNPTSSYNAIMAQYGMQNPTETAYENVPGQLAAYAANIQSNSLANSALFLGTGGNPNSPYGMASIDSIRPVVVNGTSGGGVIEISPTPTSEEYEVVSNLPQIKAQVSGAAASSTSAGDQYLLGVSAQKDVGDQAMFEGYDGLIGQDGSLTQSAVNKAFKSVQDAWSNVGKDSGKTDEELEAAQQSLQDAKKSYGDASNAYQELIAAYKNAESRLQAELQLAQQIDPNQTGTFKNGQSVNAVAAISKKLEHLETIEKGLQNDYANLQSLSKVVNDTVTEVTRQTQMVKIAEATGTGVPSTMDLLRQLGEGLGQIAESAVDEIGGVIATNGFSDAPILASEGYKNVSDAVNQFWNPSAPATTESDYKQVTKTSDELKKSEASSAFTYDQKSGRTGSVADYNLLKTQADRYNQWLAGSKSNFIQMAADGELKQSNQQFQKIYDENASTLKTIAGQISQLHGVVSGSGNISSVKGIVESLNSEFGNIGSSLGPQGSLYQASKDGKGFGYDNQIVQQNSLLQADMSRIYSSLGLEVNPNTGAPKDLNQFIAFANYANAQQQVDIQNYNIQKNYSDWLPKNEDAGAAIVNMFFSGFTAPVHLALDYAGGVAGSLVSDIGNTFGLDSWSKNGTAFEFANWRDAASIMDVVTNTENQLISGASGLVGLNLKISDTTDPWTSQILLDSWKLNDAYYDPSSTSASGSLGVWMGADGKPVDSSLQGILGAATSKNLENLNISNAIDSSLTVDSLGHNWIQEAANQNDPATMWERTAVVGAYKLAKTGAEMAAFGGVEGSLMDVASAMDAAEAVTALDGSVLGQTGGAVVGAGGIKMVSGGIMSYHFADGMINSIGSTLDNLGNNTPEGQGAVANAVADMVGTIGGMGLAHYASPENLGASAEQKSSILGSLGISSVGLAGQVALGGIGALLGNVVGLPGIGEFVGVSLQAPIAGYFTTQNAAATEAAKLANQDNLSSTQAGLLSGYLNNVLGNYSTSDLQAMKGASGTIDIAPGGISGLLSTVFGAKSAEDTSIDKSNPAFQSALNDVLATRDGSDPLADVRQLINQPGEVAKSLLGSDGLQETAEVAKPGTSLEATGDKTSDASPTPSKIDSGSPVMSLRALNQISAQADAAYSAYEANPNETTLKTYQEASQQDLSARQALSENASLVKVLNGDGGLVGHFVALSGPTSDLQLALKENSARASVIDARNDVVDATAKYLAELSKAEGKDTAAVLTAKVELAKTQENLKTVIGGANSDIALQASLLTSQAQADLSREQASNAKTEMQSALHQADASYYDAQAKLSSAKLDVLSDGGNSATTKSALADAETALNLAGIDRQLAYVGESREVLTSRYDAANGRVASAAEALGKASEADMPVARSNLESAKANQTLLKNKLDVADMALKLVQAQKALVQNPSDASAQKLLADAKSTGEVIAPKTGALQQQASAFDALAQAETRASTTRDVLKNIQSIQTQLSEVSDRIADARSKGESPATEDISLLTTLQQKATALINGRPQSEGTETETLSVATPDPSAIRDSLNEMQTSLTNDMGNSLENARAQADLARLEVQKINSDLSNDDLFSRMADNLKATAAKLVASGVGFGLLGTTASALPSADILSVSRPAVESVGQSNESSSRLSLSDYIKLEQAQRENARIVEEQTLSRNAQIQRVMRGLYDPAKLADPAFAKEAARKAQAVVALAERSGIWSPDSKNDIPVQKYDEETATGFAEHVRDTLLDAKAAQMAEQGKSPADIEKWRQGSLEKWEESNQVKAIARILQGDSIGIQMSVGGGKTVVVQGSLKARLDALGRLDADIVLKSQTEVYKYKKDDILAKDDVTMTFQNVLRTLAAKSTSLKGDGLPKVIDMADIADRLRDPSIKVKEAALADFKDAMEDPMAVRLWTAETLGHLTTHSLDASVDSKVGEILRDAQNRTARVVLADEGDVLLSDPVQYILSGESKPLGAEGLHLTKTVQDVADAVGFKLKTGEIGAFDDSREPAISRADSLPDYETRAAKGESVYFLNQEGGKWLSDSAKNYLALHNIDQGSFERITNAFEKENIDQYTIKPNEQNQEVLAPISTSDGRVQADRILQDRLFAVALARARGADADKAVQVVRKSTTALSSSGGQLFVGKSQVVVLSGSLDGVSGAAAAFGVPVENIGKAKDVWTTTDGNSKVPLTVELNFSNKEELADAIVKQVLSNKALNEGRRQLIISRDPEVRQLVADKLALELKSDVLRYDESAGDTDELAKQVDDDAREKADLVVGSMERAGRGVDYKNNVDLIVDATNMRESDLTQALGRVERFDEQKYSRFVVGLGDSVDRVVQSAYQPGVYEGLLKSSEAREDIKNNVKDGKTETIYPTTDQSGITGYGVLKAHTTFADLNSEDNASKAFEKLRLSAWRLEMSASSQGMQSNIIGIIRDIHLENPLMSLARMYPEGSPLRTALDSTISRMLNNDFYAPSSKAEVGDVISGSTRMQRDLENLRQQADSTFADVEKKIKGISGPDADALRGLIKVLRSDWQNADITWTDKKATDPEISVNVAGADTLQERINAALKSGQQLAPTVGGKAESPTAALISQVSSKIRLGENVTDQELQRVQNSASREVVNNVKNGQDLSGKVVAIANATNVSDVRTLLKADVAANSTKSSVTVGALKPTLVQTYSQARSYNQSIFSASRLALAKAFSLQFKPSLPDSIALQATANAFVDAEIGVSKSLSQAAVDEDLSNLRTIHSENLDRLAETVDPNQVAQIIAAAKESAAAKKADPTTTAAIESKFADVLAISNSAPSVKPQSGYGYRVSVRKDGTVDLYISQFTAPADLAAIQLKNYSDLTHNALVIHDRAGNNADASRRAVVSAMADESTVLVVNDGTFHPLEALRAGLRRNSESDRGALADLDRALKAIQAVDQSQASLATLPEQARESLTKRLRDQAGLDAALERLRLSAPQLSQASATGLMNLPDHVKDFVNSLGTAAQEKGTQALEQTLISYLHPAEQPSVVNGVSRDSVAVYVPATLSPAQVAVAHISQVLAAASEQPKSQDWALSAQDKWTGMLSGLSLDDLSASDIVTLAKNALKPVKQPSRSAAWNAFRSATNLQAIDNTFQQSLTQTIASDLNGQTAKSVVLVTPAGYSASGLAAINEFVQGKTGYVAMSEADYDNVQVGFKTADAERQELSVEAMLPVIQSETAKPTLSETVRSSVQQVMSSGLSLFQFSKGSTLDRDTQDGRTNSAPVPPTPGTGALFSPQEFSWRAGLVMLGTAIVYATTQFISQVNIGPEVAPVVAASVPPVHEAGMGWFAPLLVIGAFFGPRNKTPSENSTNRREKLMATLWNA